jgi:hypothetical protein
MVTKAADRKYPPVIFELIFRNFCEKYRIKTPPGLDAPEHGR